MVIIITYSESVTMTITMVWHRRKLSTSEEKMGVNSGSKLRYYLVGLSLSDICSLVRKKAEGAGRPGPGFPAVDFDVSWLCCTCRHSTIADAMESIGILSDGRIWKRKRRVAKRVLRTWTVIHKLFRVYAANSRS